MQVRTIFVVTHDSIGVSEVQAEGIPTAVASMPCWLLFEQQDEAYRDQILGTAPRVAVAAQVRMGRDRCIGRKGGFAGMSDFGMSGKIAEVYEHFGITTQAMVGAGCAAVRSRAFRTTG